METKYADLIQRLIKSTKDGKIEWKKSSTECQYRLELKSATFVIDEVENQLDQYSFETVYELTMYNNSNLEISIAKEDSTVSSKTDYSLLNELYCAAKDSCLKETHRQVYNMVVISQHQGKVNVFAHQHQKFSPKKFYCHFNNVQSSKNQQECCETFQSFSCCSISVKFRQYGIYKILKNKSSADSNKCYKERQKCYDTQKFFLL